MNKEEGSDPETSDTDREEKAKKKSLKTMRTPPPTSPGGEKSEGNIRRQSIRIKELTTSTIKKKNKGIKLTQSREIESENEDPQDKEENEDLEHNEETQTEITEEGRESAYLEKETEDITNTDKEDYPFVKYERRLKILLDSCSRITKQQIDTM